MKSDIAKRIKELRKTLDNCNQEQLGIYAGVSKSAVSQWEREVTLPERDALLQLQRTKKVNPDWVMTGKGDKYMQ